MRKLRHQELNKLSKSSQLIRGKAILLKPCLSNSRFWTLNPLNLLKMLLQKVNRKVNKSKQKGRGLITLKQITLKSVPEASAHATLTHTHTHPSSSWTNALSLTFYQLSSFPSLSPRCPSIRLCLSLAITTHFTWIPPLLLFSPSRDLGCRGKRKRSPHPALGHGST